MTVFDRIKSRVKINENGCWIWTGPKGDDGYGLIRMPPRKTFRVHRVMYAATKGDPSGLFVCHDCDTPLCVNPDHLFLGKPKENSEDMVRKGRSARGEKVNTAKLTTEKVQQIATMYKAGMSTTQIAATFGVDRSHVNVILKGKFWRNVEREIFATVERR